MRLKPVLGPSQLVFYSVGIIIGAGIYSVIGAAAGLAQDGLWASFVIAAAVATLTGLSYAEMTTSFPHAGAEYLYLKRALPKAHWAAFGVGLLVLVGGAATAATVAVAFGGYLRTFIDVPAWVAALFLLSACTAINIYGLREASWVNILFTLIECSGLVLVIAAGFSHGDITEPLRMAPGLEVIPAAAVVFFVFLGFEGIANLTEEVRDPGRNLPRAIFYSIGITTFLYVLVSLAVVTLATPEELAGSEAPVALAVQNAWPGAAPALSAIALFATANTVLISLIVSSRLAFSMARDGELPAMFSTLAPRQKTPWVASLLVLSMASALATVGELKTLAELTSFVALCAFLAVNLALIIVRFRLPKLRRPFRVPFAIGRLPLPPLFAIASICVLLVNFDRAIYIVGVGLLCLGAASYWLRKRWT